ncbi:MAG: tetratricopeptide repeat protein [Bacteroidota bacterium]|nr:tetratricopeptide repeat protein [Bacteroidota bacterium]
MKKHLLFLFFLFVNYIVSSQSFDSLITQGDEYYNSMDYEKAIDYFGKAIATDPSQSKGYWYRGDAYRESEKYVEAIKDYTEAIKLDPANWKFYRNRGRCYTKLSEYSLALKDFDKGLELEKSEAELWKYRGDCYTKMEKKDLACSDYQKSYELDKTGKAEAKELACEWTKNLVKPCPTEPYRYGNIEVDPFTGAIFICKGLSYNKFELKPEEGNGFITGPKLGIESIKLKLLEPKGFCVDDEDNAFSGLGFGLYNDKDSSLGEAEDLYKDSKKGLPLEYLKSLSMTLGFTDTTILKYGQKYTVKVRFFDKRGTAEAFIIFPFTMAANTAIHNNISSSHSSLGVGIMGGYVGAYIGKFTIIETATKKEANLFHLAANTDYKFNLEQLKDIGNNINYTLRVVDNKGNIVKETNAKTTVTNGTGAINFTTKNLVATPAGYSVWLKLDDGKDNSIGLSIPVMFDGK